MISLKMNSIFKVMLLSSRSYSFVYTDLINNWISIFWLFHSRLRFIYFTLNLIFFFNDVQSFYAWYNILQNKIIVMHARFV